MQQLSTKSRVSAYHTVLPITVCPMPVYDKMTVLLECIYQCFTLTYAYVYPISLPLEKSIYSNDTYSIVSCMNLIVAPDNLSIIPSVGLQVYNFTMSYDALIMFSHIFSIVEGKIVLHNTKCMGKP